MTDKQIKQLADKAWQEVWSDHLRNQEDVEINKYSFYQGFMKCSMYLKPLEQALIEANRHGILHYTGCMKCDVYREIQCDCGAEKTEKIVIDALEQLLKECEK